MPNDDVGVIPMDCGEERVEQGAFCFDGLEGWALCFGTLFQAGWELLDGPDDRIQLRWQLVGRGWIIDVACSISGSSFT